MTEKSSGFKMTDVGFIQDLLKTHESQQSSKFPASNAKRMVAAGELQKEEFALMQSMFCHDLKTYEVWCTRCADRESAKYHSMLQKRQDRYLQATQAARAMLTESSREWQISVTTVKDAAEGMHKINDFLGKITRSHV